MTKALIIWSLIFVCGGVALWLKGHKNPTYAPPDLPFKYLAALIYPPRLFYFLCGLPKSPDYPEGVMTAWAFSTQLIGFGFCVYASLYLFQKQNLTGSITDLTVIMILVHGLTYWLTKNRVFKSRRNRPTK